MKNVSYVVTVCLVLLFTSCKKNDAPKFWFFLGNNYTENYCQYNRAQAQGHDSIYVGHYFLVAANARSQATSYMSIILPNTSGNPTPGTYHVVFNDGQHIPTGNEVLINFGEEDFGPMVRYIGTGGNGSETVTISIVGGKVCASGNGVAVAEVAGQSTGLLNFNITETER